jgi:hypothetical protein
MAARELKIVPAGRPAYRPFGGGSAKKCYTEQVFWYTITKNPNLKAVGGDQWPTRYRLKPCRALGVHRSSVGALDQPSIALRPAVIRYRSTFIVGPPALINAVVTVASPASTSPPSISRQNPWANNVTSVAPPGILASSFSARCCSALRRGCSGGVGIVVPVRDRLLWDTTADLTELIVSCQRISPQRIIQTDRREKTPGISLGSDQR